MANEKSPIEYIPELPTGKGISPLDYSKINPYGVEFNPRVGEEQRKAEAAVEQYAEDLRKRFAQPNWFAIAGALAKPQLGGFLASMGSAATEFGRQQEAARAIEPAVSRMRAEIAANRVGFVQGLEASKYAQPGASGVLTPGQAGTAAGYVQGPQAVAAASQAQAAGTFQMFLQKLQAGRTYGELVEEYGPAAAKKYLQDASALLPNLVLPQDTPADLKSTLQAPKAGAPAAAPAPAEAAPGRPEPTPGVSSEAAGELTPKQARAMRGSDVEAQQQTFNQLNDTLTKSAAQNVPIYEISKTLYSAAANKDLKPAFAVFEQGGALDIIGRALERQDISQSFKDARRQIINARLGDTRQNKALSDLQAMEGALMDLSNKMAQGIINPTDARTMVEQASIPGLANTQDAFLRGVARIGSDALAHQERLLALGQASKRKDFDARNWGRSDELRAVNDNAAKRSEQAIRQVASQELPKHFASGLGGAFKPQAPKKSLAEQAREEAARRGLSRD
jgi:hypothetical protein